MSTCIHREGCADHHRCKAADRCLALRKDADVDRLTREEIAGAVARGYCTTANMHKELDADLVTAITNEVMALLHSLSQEAVRDEVLEEVQRATSKFPTWPTDPLHAVAVLGEEFGELTKAMLQLTYEPDKTSKEEVRKEALQTAAMALRLYASLDRYDYKRGPQHEQTALKREPNAAGQGLATAPPVTSGPAPAAPDVAEMVKRLREPRQGIHESGEEEMKTWQQLWEQCQEAAALLAKLGQGEVKATRSPYDANGLKEHPGD